MCIQVSFLYGISINSMPIIKNSKHRSNSDERVLNWKINVYYLSLIIIIKNDIKQQQKKIFFTNNFPWQISKWMELHLSKTRVLYEFLYDVSMFFVRYQLYDGNSFIVNKCQMTMQTVKKLSTILFQGKMEFIVR